MKVRLKFLDDLDVLFFGWILIIEVFYFLGDF